MISTAHNNKTMYSLLHNNNITCNESNATSFIKQIISNNEAYNESNSNRTIVISMSSLHMNVVACLSLECHNTPGLLQHN